jgi:hypothetical protein
LVSAGRYRNCPQRNRDYNGGGDVMENLLDKARADRAAADKAAELAEAARWSERQRNQELSALRAAEQIFGRPPESINWDGDRLWVHYAPEGITLVHAPFEAGSLSRGYPGEAEGFYIVGEVCDECGGCLVRASRVLRWEDFTRYFDAEPNPRGHSEECSKHPDRLNPPPAPKPQPTLGEQLVTILEGMISDQIEGHITDDHQ